MRRTPEGLLLIGRRELGKRVGQAGLGLAAAATGAKLFESSANAAVKTPGSLASFYLKHVDWEPLTLESHPAFKRIGYKDLAEVAKIHGGGDPNNRASNPDNWEFIPSEFGFAAKLKEDPDFNDTFIVTDPNTVAEGYQLLADSTAPNGLFREQRIVVGPGQNGFWTKGILVRRDGSTSEVQKFVLSKRTTDTVEENRINGTNHTVIGIDGFAGKGNLSEGFRRTGFSGGLAEVARRYGGVDTDYEWVPGEQGFGARFINYVLRLVFLDQNTVGEGSQPLWSPNSVREQRFVVNGNGQNGLYLSNVNLRPDERPDILYKFTYGRKSANQITENVGNGTNISVVGINGFRGGEQ